MEYFSELLGLTVSSIEISEDKESINFHTENGMLMYDVCRECCSYSWVESFEDTDNLIGEKILKIENKDIGTEMEEYYNGDGDLAEDVCRKIYNVDFITKKGTATLDFRNESNGYYGAYIDFLGVYK
jgi:hypothetical protein